MYSPLYINGFLVYTYFSTFNLCTVVHYYLSSTTYTYRGLNRTLMGTVFFVNRLHLFFFILEGGFDLKLGLPAISLALGKGTQWIAQDNFLTGKKYVNSSEV